MKKQNQDQDQVQDQGGDSTREEREWMRKFEEENFGRVLERDVNGDPIGEVKWRK